MKKSNNQQLAELMERHAPQCTRKWVAAIVGTNLSTVDRWLVPMKNPEDQRKKNPTYRSMPTSALSLLRLVLREVSVTAYLLERLTTGKKR